MVIALNLRHAALLVDMARSEVYALRLEGGHVLGIGRWGGCLRMRPAQSPPNDL